MAKTETESAWAKDKEFGQRLDQAFPQNEPFYLLGRRIIEGETIDTDIGPAQVVHLLVSRADENGRRTGQPFEVNAIAKAIVDKMRAAVETDFPALVVWKKVWSKKFKTDATVLHFVGDDRSVNDLAELYGIDPSTLTGAIPY